MIEVNLSLGGLFLSLGGLFLSLGGLLWPIPRCRSNTDGNLRARQLQLVATICNFTYICRGLNLGEIHRNMFLPPKHPIKSTRFESSTFCGYACIYLPPNFFLKIFNTLDEH